jgi:arylsulfatase A-like enzyme
MPRSASAPNVLLVIADDHRADAIGGLGHPVVQTPVLDQLVRAGTTFMRASMMGGLMPAVCAPARACLLTGRNVFAADASPALLRGPEFEVRLPAEACTLPERFRAAGYETFMTGKWHNDVPSLLRSFEAGRNIFKGGMCAHSSVPVRNLMDFHSGTPARVAAGFSTEIFCDTAAAFLRERKRNRPFFACVALTSPHDPRTPPAELRARYNPETLPLPPNFLPEHPFDNGDLRVRDETLAAHPLSPAVLRQHLADYYGMISHHDAWLGRLLAALDETGEAGNTIVAYVSDHGLALGSHGLLGKQNLYEHSVRVPFILRGPGIPPGGRTTALAYAFDLYATLCALSGLSVPAGIDSRSLVPVFTGGSAVREELGCVYMDGQRMITDGRWKLIVYHVDGNERLQLFDLANDPHELSDRSESAGYQDHVTRLLERLGRWQQQVGDRWWPAATPMR